MGAPRGNRNAAKAKVWTAAIERALDRRKPADKRIKAIDELAERLLDACADGNLAALQELGNRLEGKPSQDVSVSGSINHTLEDIYAQCAESERGPRTIDGSAVEVKQSLPRH
jgi:hypothetical protein